MLLRHIQEDNKRSSKIVKLAAKVEGREPMTFFVNAVAVFREFRKLLRRHRRQRRLKNDFIFYLRISMLLSHLLCLSLSKLSRN